MLTGKQKKWMKTKIMVAHVRPRVAFLKPENAYRCRVYIYNVVVNKTFDNLITIAIIASTLLMTMSWAQMSETDHFRIEILNHAFKYLFMIEIILRLIAFKLRFFRDNWNIFDFMIVILPFVIQIVLYFNDFGIENNTVT